MGGAHEVAEKIEHAAHGEGHAHGGGGIGRLAGITMAILGVMLALCAALVGGERTELVTTMVEQSNTWNKYQAQRMKHRLMLTELATLHALSPSLTQLRKFQEELAAQGKAEGGEGTSDIRSVVGLSTQSLVAILTPRHDDIERILKATRRYGEQLEAAQKWAEAYDEAIEAHTMAAEHFEWGQLAAEIGIVVASVALLLSNRKAWYIAVALGASCLGVVGWTFATTRGHVHHAEHAIEEAKKEYKHLRNDKESEEEDKALITDVERKLHQSLPGTPPPAGGHAEGEKH